MQRQTLVVLATFVALLAGAFSVLRRPHEAGMERLDTRALARANIDRIELRGAHTVTLRKEGAQWQLDNGHTIEPALMGEALQKLTSLNTSDFVTEDTGRFAELGVEGDRALSLRASANGAVVANLLLARAAEQEAPSFGGPVGHVRQNDRVFAENAGLVEMFWRDAGAWEDRVVVPASEQEVAQLEVRLQKEPGYALTRSGDTFVLGEALDGGKIVSPKRFDGQQAAALVARLTSSRASTLVDDDPGPAVTGLDDAQADRLTWQYTEATKARLGAAAKTLYLGKNRQEGGVWARVSDGPRPFAVDEATAEGLRRPLASMQDLTLMAAADVEQAVRFTIEAKPGQRTEFVNKGGTWELARAGGLAKGFVLDPIKLKARMRQALLTRAIGLAPVAKLASPGANGRVTLTLADKTQHVLQFGRATKYQGTPAFEAQGSADAQVYYASKPLRDNIVGSLEALGRTAPKNAATAQGAAPGGPQGLDSLPPEVQESIRRQLAGATQAP